MKVRVPARIKHAFQALASQDLTSESEVARKALIEYLRRHAPIYLVDEPVSSSTTAAVDQEAAEVAGGAVDDVTGGGATSLPPPDDEPGAKPRRRKGKK